MSDRRSSPENPEHTPDSHAIDLLIEQEAFEGVFHGPFGPSSASVLQELPPHVARAAIIRAVIDNLPEPSRQSFLLGVALTVQAYERSAAIHDVNEIFSNTIYPPEP